MATNTMNTAQQLGVPHGVVKYLKALYGHVRINIPDQYMHSYVASCSVSSARGRHWWLVAVMDQADGEEGDSRPEMRWRSMRGKWEAICVLTCLANQYVAFSLSNWAFWSHVLGRWLGCPGGDVDRLASFLASDHHVPRMRWVVDFSYMDLSGDEFVLARHMLLGVRRPARISYVKFLQYLSRDSKPTDHGRAILGLRMQRCRFSEEAMKQLQRLVVDVAHAADTTRTGLASKLYPASLTLSWCQWDVAFLDLSASQMCKEQLSVLAGIVNDPYVALRHLSLDKIFDESTPREYMASFGSLLSSIFTVQHDVHDDVGTCALASLSVHDSSSEKHRRMKPIGSVSSVSLDWNVLSFHHLSALFTAIHKARSVDELSLVGAFHRFEGRRDEPWMWLAYGIFQASSNCSVQRLDLSQNSLRSEFVMAMRQVLQSKHISAFLAPEVHPSRSNQRVRTVATGHVARIKQLAKLYTTPSLQSSISLVLNEESSFEVLENMSKWVCVVVPGFGRLWVQRSYVLSVREAAAHGVRHSQHRSNRENSASRSRRVTALILQDMELCEPSTALQQLLDTAAIGSYLTQLDLSYNRLTNRDVSSFMRSCPLLRHLELRGCELTSVSALVDAFHSDRCRIEVLILPDNAICRHDVVRLMAILRDTTLSACQQLRVLELDGNPIGKRGVESILKTLEENDKVTLDFLVLSRDQDPEGGVRDRLELFNGQDLGTAFPPLASQLGFLSISCRSEYSALPLLDPVLVREIFELSGWRRRRQITLCRTLMHRGSQRELHRRFAGPFSGSSG